MPSNILIVEDELIVALELEDRLRRQGYAIVGTARTAEEALAQSEAAPVDLALVDVRLAGQRDGIDLARDLQARAIPVVFLTAHGDDETLARVNSVGAQGYLLKPFDARLLHLTIETALHRHRAERARLEAERGRRAAESLQATILEHSPDGVLLVAQDGTIELANRAAQAIFKLDTLGRAPRAKLQLHELIPGLAPGEPLPICADRAVRRIQARRVDGEIFPAELACGLAPLLDDDPRQRLIVIVRDISTQSQLEQELAHARQLEVAGRVASGVAHDLNNLLSVVWMSTYMLHTEPLSERSELLEDLDSAVNLGAALTARLLSMARRKGSGARHLPVNEALRAISRLIKRTTHAEVQIVMELDPRAGTVHIDPAGFDQMMLNLIINADRAMPEGGQLTIRSRAIAVDGALALTAIEVEDTGVGMDAATQRRAFEPFFSTRSAAGGTGLGLSIIKDIVGHADGELEFESTLGRGTRFWISLPRSGDAEGEAQWAPIEGSTLAGEGRTILLVDDDHLHRRALARLLEAKGFRTLHAPGAGEAILIAEREPEQIAVAVVDLEMPYMDGIELSARLEQLRHGLPIMLLSGTAIVLNAKPAQAHAVLRKPVQPELLFDQLASLLVGPKDRA